MFRKKTIFAAAAAAAMSAGLLVGPTVSAEAASCSFSRDTWTTYNYTCTQARHYNVVDPPGWFNTTTYYARWVGKWKNSTNGVCYAYNVGYGSQIRV